jgi:hypothetical protein
MFEPRAKVMNWAERHNAVEAEIPEFWNLV